MATKRAFEENVVHVTGIGSNSPELMRLLNSGYSSSLSGFGNLDENGTELGAGTKEETEEAKVRRILTQSAISEFGAKIDSMLSDIGQRISDININISDLIAANKKIQEERNALISERDGLRGELLESAENAVENTEQAIEVAQQDIIAAADSKSATRAENKYNALVNRLQEETDILEQRRQGIYISDATPEHLAKMEAGIESRLSKIETRLQELDEQEQGNNNKISELTEERTRLEAQQAELLEVKDKLENDTEFRQNVENGNYTVGDMLGNFSEEFQETVGSWIETNITNDDSTWNQFKQSLSFEAIAEKTNLTLANVLPASLSFGSSATPVTEEAVQIAQNNTPKVAVATHNIG